jgi:hypothetical protein
VRIQNDTTVVPCIVQSARHRELRRGYRTRSKDQDIGNKVYNSMKHYLCHPSYQPRQLPTSLDRSPLPRALAPSSQINDKSMILLIRNSGSIRSTASGTHPTDIFFSSSSSTSLRCLVFDGDRIVMTLGWWIAVSDPHRPSVRASHLLQMSEHLHSNGTPIDKLDRSSHLTVTSRSIFPHRTAHFKLCG